MAKKDEPRILSANEGAKNRQFRFGLQSHIDQALVDHDMANFSEFDNAGVDRPKKSESPVEELYRQEADAARQGSNPTELERERQALGEVLEKDNGGDEPEVEERTRSRRENAPLNADGTSPDGSYFDGPDLRARYKKRRKKMRRKSFLAGILFSVLGPFGALMVLPHAISQMIESKMGGYVKLAQDKIGERMFAGYMADRLGQIRSCGGGSYSSVPGTEFYRATPCNVGATDPDAGWLRRTYDNYNANGMEARLAQNGIGIEFSASGNGGVGSWSILKNGAPITGLSSLDFNNLNVLEDLGTNEAGKLLRADIRKAAREETKSWQVLKQRRLIKAVERRWGVTFCRMACSQKDYIRNGRVRLSNGWSRYKARTTAALIRPLSANMGLIAGCLIGPEDCTSEDFRNNHAKTYNKLTAKIVRNIGVSATADVADAAAKQAVEEFLKELQDAKVAGKGVGTFLIEKAIKNVMGQTAAKFAASAIPIAGQIYAIASLGNAVATLSNVLPKILSERNMAVLAAGYANFNVVTNESRLLGSMSLPEYGEFVSSFLGLQHSRALRLMTNPSGAYPTSQPYPCIPAGIEGPADDVGNFVGKTLGTVQTSIPAGAASCGAFMASASVGLLNNGVFAVVRGVFDNPVVGGAVGLVNGVVSGVSDGIFAAADFLGFGGAKDWATDQVSGLILPTLTAFTMAMAPSLADVADLASGFDNLKDLALNPFNTKVYADNGKMIVKSGAPIVDMMIGGADVQYNHTLAKEMGGVRISSGQEAALTRAIADNAKYDMKVASIGDRLWSLDGMPSLLTYATVGVSTNTSVANFLNPFSNLKMAFSPVNKTFTSNTFAAGVPNNAFEVQRYGFSVEDLDSITVEDLEGFDKAACEEVKKLRLAEIEQREKDAVNSANTDGSIDANGEGSPSSAQKCILIEYMTDSFNRLFEKE